MLLVRGTILIPFVSIFGGHQSFFGGHWYPYFELLMMVTLGCLDMPMCKGFLIFTFGVTPADLLMGSMETETFFIYILEEVFTSIGGNLNPFLYIAYILFRLLVISINSIYIWTNLFQPQMHRSLCAATHSPWQNKISLSLQLTQGHGREMNFTWVLVMIAE